MQSSLLYLYQALGLELDADEPMLYVDDDLQIYFDELEEQFEMCCPLMALPEDIALLQACLRINYASPILFATDADNTVLLAVHRLSKESTGAALLSGLELLVNTAKQFRQEYA